MIKERYRMTYRKRMKFAFNVYTYPADGSPSDLHAEHVTKKASTEHGARRLVIEEAHEKDRCVYSIELSDTHAEGGELVAA